MDTRRRQRPLETNQRPASDGEEIRTEPAARRTERLLAAADAAIARALSRDSEQFLLAARQTGGQ
jgi:hypothetical protein